MRTAVASPERPSRPLYVLLLEERLASVAAIHYASKNWDYVQIPPKLETVCLACPVSDGYQLWPCETARAIGVA